LGGAIYCSKNRSDFLGGANYYLKIHGKSPRIANYSSKNCADQNNRCHENVGKFCEILFQAKFLRKAPKSQEFRRNSFALPLHNTVISGQIEEMSDQNEDLKGHMSC